MHTIRLREPWEIDSQPGRVIYRRHFNRPTGLEPGSVVRLAIDGLHPTAQVRFNHQPLSAAESTAWDITPNLQPRNAIVIEIAETQPQDLPFTQARLEIADS